MEGVSVTSLDDFLGRPRGAESLRSAELAAPPEDIDAVPVLLEAAGRPGRLGSIGAVADLAALALARAGFVGPDFVAVFIPRAIVLPVLPGADFPFVDLAGIDLPPRARVEVLPAVIRGLRVVAAGDDAAALVRRVRPATLLAAVVAALLRVATRVLPVVVRLPAVLAPRAGVRVAALAAEARPRAEPAVAVLDVVLRAEAAGVDLALRPGVAAFVGFVAFSGFAARGVDFAASFFAAAERTAGLFAVRMVRAVAVRPVGAARRLPAFAEPAFAGPDFAGSDLAALDLAAPDFAGLDFAGLDFAGLDFAGPDFTGADFAAIARALGRRGPVLSLLSMILLFHEVRAVL